MASITVEQFIRECAARLDAAGLCFGHGSDNAFDEAAELVFFALGLEHADAEKAYGLAISTPELAKARELVERRIRERIPAAYLTRRMWFAGHEFFVDERVLVPRSPFAELIEARFAPWVEGPGRVLDIGTGSGCIAIAVAHAFPAAQVDAADVSDDALAVTAINIERHGLKDRVRPLRADVFDGVGDSRYDLIVSNPPYVSAAEVAGLPPEYGHEPRLGLLAGTDGLSIVHRILADAERHLTKDGVLIVEVGDTENTLQAKYPRVPFTWLEFERGGGGVFLLTAAELRTFREEFTASAAD